MASEINEALDRRSAGVRGCPVCGNALFVRPLAASGREGHGKRQGRAGGARLWRCRHCGYIFRDKGYVGDGVEEYFDHAEYVLPDNEEVYRRLKQGMFREVVRRTSEQFDFQGRAGNLIDFGCSYGHLALQFKAAGWNVIGVDIAPSVVALHREQGNFPAYQSLDEPQIPDGWADAVAMIDVLYYVHDPIPLLRKVFAKLASPGVLVLRVSNRCQYLRAAALGQKILRVNLVGRLECDHVGYWCKKALRTAAARAGFDRVRIIRRERGYWYRPARKLFHWSTQLVSHVTRGLIDPGMVIHAELWKTGRAATAQH